MRAAAVRKSIKHLEVSLTRQTLPDGMQALKTILRLAHVLPIHMSHAQITLTFCRSTTKLDAPPLVHTSMQSPFLPKLSFYGDILSLKTLFYALKAAKMNNRRIDLIRVMKAKGVRFRRDEAAEIIYQRYLLVKCSSIRTRKQQSPLEAEVYLEKSQD